MEIGHHRLEFSQSVQNQENLLDYLERAIAGDYSGLENSYEILLETQKSIGFNPPPSFIAETLNVFRCNIFSNAEERHSYMRAPKKWQRVSTRGVSFTLDSLCKKYDNLSINPPWDLKFPVNPLTYLFFHGLVIATFLIPSR